MSRGVADNASENIAALVGAGHTVADLEISLGLSPGYLSKVRHGAVRPSAQLVALLQVVRSHPETLATVRRAVGAPPKVRGPARPQRRPAADAALQVLVELAPRLNAAGVRWALAGAWALRAHFAGVPAAPGADIVVHDGDRHVLQLLREEGRAVVFHPPSLAVCRIPAGGPNDGLRIHFPTTPPLSTAFERTVEVEILRKAVPAVDLASLTLANLLSQRTGAEEAAAHGVAAGVSVAALRRELDALDALPPTKSPYLLRVFDRALARERLSRLGSP